jgi:hypothetical protein
MQAANNTLLYNNKLGDEQLWKANEEVRTCFRIEKEDPEIRQSDFLRYFSDIRLAAAFRPRGGCIRDTIGSEYRNPPEVPVPAEQQ